MTTLDGILDGLSGSLTTIAYFSMEVGIESDMPTYSGGLGLLAGDILRAAADLGVPMVGVTLLHRKGYFKQRLDEFGNQSESPEEWSPEKVLQIVKQRISVTLESRQVYVQAWRYQIRGINGHSIPLYLLDTLLPENSPGDQHLTDYLYGGDDRYRLCQEAILGLGGVSMLRALGYTQVKTYHMNEGHSALIALALLNEQRNGHAQNNFNGLDIEAVRQKCVFTTHTPVQDGHDNFSLDLVRRVLGDDQINILKNSNGCLKNSLDETYLALYSSRYVNGVAMRHGEITRTMYPDYPIDSITNGVHAVTWTSDAFKLLYDEYIPRWRSDNDYLRNAIGIPSDKIREAHEESKRELLSEIERQTGVKLSPDVMTIGFARRATTYKRSDLLFTDIEHLKRIAGNVGPFQVVYAGKAHPRDESGKNLIRRVFEAKSALKDAIPVVYLEQYNMQLGKLMCAGVDVWLNTPQKPLEASGTSGMKAALNGVPSLSILDGWWVEGCIEGVTGWSIGDHWLAESNYNLEVASLYKKLEDLILPTFYQRPAVFADIMRSTIAINGSFFNAQRMVSQYLKNAYTPAITKSTDGKSISNLTLLAIKKCESVK